MVSECWNSNECRQINVESESSRNRSSVGGWVKTVAIQPAYISFLSRSDRGIFPTNQSKQPNNDSRYAVIDASFETLCLAPPIFKGVYRVKKRQGLT